MQSQASADLLSDSRNTQAIISSALERYLKLSTSEGLWNHGLMPFYEALAHASQLGKISGTRRLVAVKFRLQRFVLIIGV
jgi:hypothetical protein